MPKAVVQTRQSIQLPSKHKLTTLLEKTGGKSLVFIKLSTLELCHKQREKLK